MRRKENNADHQSFFFRVVCVCVSARDRVSQARSRELSQSRKFIFRVFNNKSFRNFFCSLLHTRHRARLRYGKTRKIAARGTHFLASLSLGKISAVLFIQERVSERGATHAPLRFSVFFPPTTFLTPPLLEHRHTLHAKRFPSDTVVVVVVPAEIAAKSPA